MDKQIIRHGEVIITPIDTLPEKLSLVEENMSIIVAHSETGHHHVLGTKVLDKKIKLFKTDIGDMYLDVPVDSELWHEKSGVDVHTPHKVKSGLYKINLKKEFDYFAKVLRIVRD